MPLDEGDAVRLADMVEFGDKVVAMVAGMSLSQFMGDERTLFAVCYGIQVVGEAGWKLSDNLKSHHTEVPWPLIASMRHRLVHDYGRTDEKIVYTVATVHLPQLLARVRAIQEQG